jgi:hypothetical protein
MPQIIQEYRLLSLTPQQDRLSGPAVALAAAQQWKEKLSRIHFQHDSRQQRIPVRPGFVKNGEDDLELQHAGGFVPLEVGHEDAPAA